MNLYLTKEGEGFKISFKSFSTPFLYSYFFLSWMHLREFIIFYYLY